MPELPEVETTVSGLNKVLPNLSILNMWTDLSKEHLKEIAKKIKGRKILSVSRRGKNILIHLSQNHTLLVHMKMTGHLLYGKYSYNKKENKWTPKEDGPLKDPYNRFVHVVFSLSNNKELAFSDTRKFGKIALILGDPLHSPHLSHIGPDPLTKEMTLSAFKKVLSKKPKGKIKSVLMDQTVIAGIGNIYSDEILWYAGIHPEQKVADLIEQKIKEIFSAMKKILRKGIDFGGDSMSDYRNIYGEKGNFQNKHEAYRRTGQKCRKSGCTGVIIKKTVGGRSAHFCSKHQILK